MKTFIKLSLLLTCLLSSVARADVPLATATSNPISDTTPFVKGDETKVFAFFKFNCPVCRNYHISLEYWGKSLPKQMEFQFIPVLESGGGQPISDESARSSMMFWTAELSGSRTQRAAFADAAYALTQDAHIQESPEAWMGAIADSGIDPRRFSKAWKIEQEIWSSRVNRQVHYKPTRTPSLVICGKWMISPDSTNGNQELFFQLANGLVSKCMTEHNIPR